MVVFGIWMGFVTIKCPNDLQLNAIVGVSRHVGELASKGAGGQGSRWRAQWLNDLDDPCPPAHYASGADVTDTRATW